MRHFVKIVLLGWALTALAQANNLPPLRDCTLSVPADAVSLTAPEKAPYLKDGQLVLETGGLLFQPVPGKNIEGRPSGDNTTSFRCVINYHRCLRNGTAEEIAAYWYPAETSRVREHFSRPGVLESTRARLGSHDNIDLLGMLEIQGREVVFVRYDQTVHGFVTLPVDGDYRIVTDPGVAVPVAIACAALEHGSAVMAPR